jgi:hypothetical protein
MAALLITLVAFVVVAALAWSLVRLLKDAS